MVGKTCDAAAAGRRHGCKRPPTPPQLLDGFAAEVEDKRTQLEREDRKLAEGGCGQVGGRGGEGSRLGKVSGQCPRRQC